MQLDLFLKAAPAPPKILREEEKFGFWDAKTGLPRRNRYSVQLPPDRLSAYERGYQKGIKEWESL